MGQYLGIFAASVVSMGVLVLIVAGVPRLDSAPAALLHARPPFSTVVSLAIFSALTGAVCGWAAEWVAAFLDMGLRGAGYTGTEARWDPAYASFSATSFGMPFGVLYALLGYTVFFRHLPARIVVRAVPTLFVAVLLGASLGALLATPGPFFVAPAAFFLACSYTVQRAHALAEQGVAGDVRPGIVPE
jgi:hypothetical protein